MGVNFYIFVIDLWKILERLFRTDEIFELAMKLISSDRCNFHFLLMIRSIHLFLSPILRFILDLVLVLFRF